MGLDNSVQSQSVAAHPSHLKRHEYKPLPIAPAASTLQLILQLSSHRLSSLVQKYGRQLEILQADFFAQHEKPPRSDAFDFLSNHHIDPAVDSTRVIRTDAVNIHEHHAAQSMQNQLQPHVQRLERNLQSPIGSLQYSKHVVLHHPHEKAMHWRTQLANHAAQLLQFAVALTTVFHLMLCALHVPIALQKALEKAF